MAQEAFESWSLTSKSERAQTSRDIGDKLMAQKDKIAMIETLNNGKPIRETTAISISHLLQEISIICKCY